MLAQLVTNLLSELLRRCTEVVVWLYLFQLVVFKATKRGGKRFVNLTFL